MDHLCEEARRVGASGETEDVDVVTRGVVAHKELVAGEDMVHEACADGLINGGIHSGFESGD